MLTIAQKLCSSTALIQCSLELHLTVSDELQQKNSQQWTLFSFEGKNCFNCQNILRRGSLWKFCKKIWTLQDDKSCKNLARWHKSCKILARMSARILQDVCFFPTRELSNLESWFTRMTEFTNLLRSVDVKVATRRFPHVRNCPFTRISMASFWMKALFF